MFQEHYIDPIYIMWDVGWDDGFGCGLGRRFRSWDDGFDPGTTVWESPKDDGFNETLTF